MSDFWGRDGEASKIISRLQAKLDQIMASQQVQDEHVRRLVQEETARADKAEAQLADARDMTARAEKAEAEVSRLRAEPVRMEAEGIAYALRKAQDHAKRLEEMWREARAATEGACDRALAAEDEASDLRESRANLEQALREAQASCPCRRLGPCRPLCSCAHIFHSGGCDRCCAHGSEEQKRATALRIEAAMQLAEAFDRAEPWLEAVLCDEGRPARDALREKLVTYRKAGTRTV